MIFKNYRLFIYCLFGSFFLLLNTVNRCLIANAQTTNEQTEAQKRKEEIELQIAEEQLRQLQLQNAQSALGGFSGQGLPEGNISTDSQKIEATILARKALYENAKKIKEQLDIHFKSEKPNYLIVTDRQGSVLKMMKFYQSFRANISAFQSVYEDFLAEEKSQKISFVPSIPSGLQFLTNFAGIFRQNVSLKGVEVKTGSTEILASFLGSQYTPLKTQRISSFENCLPTIVENKTTYVYYPVIYGIDGQNISSSGCLQAVLEDLKKLQEQRSELAIKILNLEKKTKRNSEEESNLQRYKKLNEQFDQFLTSIYTFQTDSMNTFAQIAFAEKLQQMLNNNGYLLFLVNVDVGGTNRTNSNLFGNSVKYSGSSLIIYEIRDRYDNVLFYGHTGHHTGFHSLKNEESFSFSDSN